MKYKVFSIYDSKAEAYLQPIFMANKGVAIRAIVETLKNDDHQFSKTPEDFTLFELGEYDDSTGMMEPHATPLSIAKANELKPLTQKI